ncbi:MAG: glycosyltransferase [Ancrocorticia sp.]
MNPLTPPARDVLAVLVTRADDQYFTDTLRAVADQELLPGRLTIVLAGESDESDLARVEGMVSEYVTTTTRVIAAPNAQNFAQAVNGAVDGEESWLWLLHADGAPRPSCLQLQVRLAETSPKIGAVGVKQVAWDDPRDLYEVGIRATRSARRVPEIEPGEFDQGQLDYREDVLAVGSVAMLVRREAFEAVGRLDAALGPYGDGLEFSRRLWSAGWRVVVEPNAVIAHARTSLDAPTSATFASRRSAQLYNAALAAPAIGLVLLVLGQLVLAPMRAVGRLISKDVRHAVPELAGAYRFVRMLPALMAARRRLASVTRVPRAVLKALEESPRDVWLAQRHVRHSQEDAAAMADMPGPLELRELAAAQRSRRIWGTLTLVVAVLGSVVGLIPLIGRGVLTGGALLPDASSFRDLAAMAASGWLPAGDGLAAPVDALWLVLGPLVLLTTPLGGSLGAVASTIVMTGIVLSAVAAFWASGRIASSAPLRALAALMWAFAPPLLAAVSVGHVAGIVWHVLAPALVACALDTWRTPSVRALGRTALLLAIMSAAAPATALLILPVLAGVAYRRAWRWLWIPVPTLALLAPTLLAAARVEAGWKLLLASPGQPLATSVSAFDILTFSPALADAVALDSSGSSAFASVVGTALPIIFTLLLVIPIAALLARADWRVWIGWSAVGVGIIWAVACAVTEVAVVAQVPALAAATAWPGMALSLSVLGLWLALVGGGDMLRGMLEAPGWPRIAAICAAASVALSCLGQANMWAGQSLRGDTPLSSASASSLPAVAMAEQRGDYRSRVLEIIPSDAGSVISVLRGPGAQLHDNSMVAGILNLSSQSAGLDAAREDLAQALADPSGSGAAQIFAEHAISHVFVPASEDPDSDDARKALISRLGGVGGLEFVTENTSGAFWRVRVGIGEADAPSTSRLRIDDDETTVSLTSGRIGSRLDIPAGGQGRRLVLSERADAGWGATFDGVALGAVSDGWRQAWELPAHAGHLRIHYGGSVPWILYGQVAVLGVALVLALPTRRRKQAWV